MGTISEACARRLAAVLALPAGLPARADLIFSFAGRKSRKLYAIDLYSTGYAPRLILSTGRFEIRRYCQLPHVPPLDLLAIAAPTPPALRHFFVVVENGTAQAQLISKKRLGTLTEVAALRTWLAEHPENSSVVVISSTSHLRRIRRCWHALIPRDIRVQFLASPDDDAQSLRALLKEMTKLCLYMFVLAFHRFWSDLA